MRKLGGVPLTPKALYKELETGCFRAVPDNEASADKFLEFFSKSKEDRLKHGAETRKNFEKFYQWDISGKAWENYFDSVELLPVENTWASPPDLTPSAEKINPDGQIPPSQLARWLIVEVLREPRFANTFLEARLTRDLLYQSSTGTTGGMYFNESSAAFDGKSTRTPFNFDMAYNHFRELNQRRIFWEQKRIERFSQQ